MNRCIKYLYRHLRFVLFLGTTLISTALGGQNKEQLSAEGMRHWKAAEALLEVASNTDELVSVTKEFELVLKTDPDYADAYFNLGRLYSKIGKDKGDQYFNKAKDAFNKYLELNPKDKQLIEDELYIVEALRQGTAKTRSEHSKKEYVGVWKGEDSPWSWLTFNIEDVNGSYRIIITNKYRANWQHVMNDTRFVDGKLYCSDSKTEYRNGSTWTVSTSTWSVTCDKNVVTSQYVFSINDNVISVYEEQEDYYYLRGSQIDHTSNKYNYTLRKL